MLRKSDESRMLAAGVLLESVATPAPSEETVCKPSEFNRTSISVIIASFISHFIILGLFYSFGVYLVIYVRVLNLGNASSVSFIGTVAIGSLTGFGIVSGWLSDRYGSRTISFTGAIVMAIGLFCASFATELWHFILTQGFLAGFGSSLAYFPALSAPPRHFEKHRGLALGIAVTGAGVGGFAGPIILQALLSSVGHAWTLRITALFALVILTPTSYFYTAPKMEHMQIQKFPTFLLRDPAFYLLAAMPMIAAFGYLVPILYVPTVCRSFCIHIQYAVSIGMTAQQGAYAVSAFSALSTVGRFVISASADRILGRLNTFILCIFMSGLTIMLLWPFASVSFGMLVFFMASAGFFRGGSISLPAAVIADIYGVQALASMIALLYSTFTFGAVFGGPLAGYIFQKTQSIAGGTYWIPTIMFAGAIQSASCIFGIAAKLMIMRRVGRKAELKLATDSHGVPLTTTTEPRELEL